MTPDAPALKPMAPSAPTPLDRPVVPTGLLLFAHGARDARWALPFQAVAARVRAAAPGTPLRLAFLEFMTPGLVDAGHALAAAGCRQVQVLPLFLGAGGHVRKDLPLLLDQLRAAHPEVEWALCPSIGEADTVVEAMAGVALAALSDVAPQAPPLAAAAVPR